MPSKNDKSDFPEKARPASNALYLDAAMRNAGSMFGSRHVASGSNGAIPLPWIRMGALFLALLHIVMVFWVSSCISRSRQPAPIPARATVYAAAESLIFLEITDASWGVGARATLPADALDAAEGDTVDLYLVPGSYSPPSDIPGDRDPSVDVLLETNETALRTEAWLLAAACAAVLALDAAFILRRVRRARAA